MKTRIPYICKGLSFVVLGMICLSSAQGGKKHDKDNDAKGEITANARPVLWQDPTDLETRDLFYGPGGPEHQPKAPFTFVEEDKSGSNPKFIVRDGNGVKWTVKMGAEARPETVATRLVWAVGYFTPEDYFMNALPVQNMGKLHRGESQVDPVGQVYDVRLKRRSNKEEKKLGEWKWADNPFYGTREFNGLRVMMALINNWDLKDVNNAIFYRKNPPEKIYMISDLGATFGAAELERTHEKSKGNLESFAHSKFIRSEHEDRIDFETPNRPALVAAINPKQFVRRVNLEWIGKDIPREDARWMGRLLARLSHKQIRDAFRAAGYPPEEMEGFAQIVEARIAELYAM